MRPRIVVVGAGHAGVQLVDSLRAEGYTGDVVLVGGEREHPYQRPPLTKDFLKDAESAELLPLRGKDFFQERHVDLHLGHRAVGIDRHKRTLLLDDGNRLAYDELVLATGARSQEHPAASSGPRAVHFIRDAADAQRFGRELEAARSIVVVGAGFIGLEVAAAARQRGVEVTLITRSEPLSRVASAPLSAFLTVAHTSMGTTMVTDEVTVIEDAPTGSGAIVHGASGLRIDTDLVLIAVGASPNAELARDAGLTVENGIVVDEFSRTSDAHIWAVGDVAVRSSGEIPIREESVQAATHQAECLARTLTGTPTRCTDVPWFWSTQGALRLQIAGLPRAAAESVVRGDPRSNRFSVFNYWRGHLVNVESVNSPADHLAARRILASGRHLSAEHAGDLTFDLKAFSREQAAVVA